MCILYGSNGDNQKPNLAINAPTLSSPDLSAHTVRVKRRKKGEHVGSCSAADNCHKRFIESSEAGLFTSNNANNTAEAGAMLFAKTSKKKKEKERERRRRHIWTRRWKAWARPFCRDNCR